MLGLPQYGSPNFNNYKIKYRTCPNFLGFLYLKKGY